VSLLAVEDGGTVEKMPPRRIARIPAGELFSTSYGTLPIRQKKMALPAYCGEGPVTVRRNPFTRGIDI
jgi:hypothetical protein